jgi:hypothetical protein
MHHTLDPRASLLLELMREADDEAVTLDELAIAGVEDPASALLALELAGFGLERVVDTSERGREIPCVRLSRPTWPIDAPPAAPVVASVSPGETNTTTIVLLALLSLGLLWLVRAVLRAR